MSSFQCFPDEQEQIAIGYRNIYNKLCSHNQLTECIAIGLGLGPQNGEKKRSLPSQSGRSRTGKYWDGAWAEAHTSRRDPLRTRSPCYGASPRPTNPGSWRGLCHQGKYEVLLQNSILLILLSSMHGPYHVFSRLTSHDNLLYYCLLSPPMQFQFGKSTVQATVPDVAGSPKIVCWTFFYPRKYLSTIHCQMIWTSRSDCSGH